MNALLWLARDQSPARHSPASLVAASIGLGLAAHQFGGGATPTHCAPLLVAAAVGVLASGYAQRISGLVHHGTPVAAGLLGLGQFGMHVAFTASTAGHLDRPSSGAGLALPLGLSCGLVVAHSLATALLAILLIGAHQTAEQTLHLLARALGSCGVRILWVSPTPIDLAQPVVLPVWSPKGCCRRWWNLGMGGARRGPPASD